MKNLIFGVHPVQYPAKPGAGTGRARTLKGKIKRFLGIKIKPLDLGTVAIWNEYGTENAPPRPAFRMGLEESIKRNQKMIDAQMRNITQRVLTGRASEIDRSLTVLLTQIGKSAKAETQRIIRSGSTEGIEKNAQMTIDRKGFDHPLYETGLLLKNVDYEVRDA